jgi:hypothetical protein
MVGQVTRIESVLGVRQCTAVNPHVLPLIAARVKCVEDSDSSDSDDDERLDAGDLAGPSWCALCNAGVLALLAPVST